MPALLERIVAAAIVAQLSVAGVVVAAGGPGAEAAVALERAEILDTARVAERETFAAAAATGPIEVAAAPAATGPLIPPPGTALPPTTTAPAPTTSTTPAPAPAAAPPPATAPPTTAAASAPAPAPPAARSDTTAAGSWRDAACESSMLGWMGEARIAGGRRGLADDPAVDHVAFAWSDHLASSGDLQHNPRYSEQVFAARPEAMTVGEVVGRGSEARPIFDEFLRSPTHRDAIMRPAFTHATVGCVRDAAGQVWVTANFWG